MPLWAKRLSTKPTRRKRHEPEQIVSRLRNAAAVLNSGEGHGRCSAVSRDRRGVADGLAGRATPRSSGLDGMKSEERGACNAGGPRVSRWTQGNWTQGSLSALNRPNPAWYPCTCAPPAIPNARQNTKPGPP
jgi:hypothetical protein